MFLAARAAQRIAEDWSSEIADDVVSGLAHHVYRAETARRLCRLAVDESGIGNPVDSSVRLRTRILATLQEMAGVRAIGLVEEDPAKGLRRYAKPIGVIAALIPATAPAAAVIVHTLNAMKTRNAVIFCPNPRVVDTVTLAVEVIREALENLGAPLDLVQAIVTPTRDCVDAIVAEADLVVATGGQRTVARALSLGTPGYAGGVGNALVLIDGTADIALAAEQIAAGKAFDNGTSCSAESCILVERSQSQVLVRALARRGGVVLDAKQSDRLMEWVWPGGELRRDAVGKSAAEIAAAAGLAVPSQTRFLLLGAVPETAHLVGREKLSPILGLVPVQGTAEMSAIAGALLERQGKGHSCAIFSRSEQTVDFLAQRLPVSRIMVNQSTGLGNTGSHTNGMPASVVLSCGPWGGTNDNANITWRQFLNYTVASTPIAPRCYDERELFGRHWRPEVGYASADSSSAAVPAV